MHNYYSVYFSFFSFSIMVTRLTMNLKMFFTLVIINVQVNGHYL